MMQPLRLVLVVCTSLAAACSAVASHPEAPAEATQRAPRSIPVFDGHTGEPASWDTLAAAIDDAEVVILGELHGHPVGLPFDAALFTAALLRHPDAALCLEFLTRDGQYLVDAYLAGLIDWDTFAAGVSRAAGSDPLPHRPLLEAARDAGITTIAANAPRIYTRAAKERGYEALEALGPEQQRLFDVPLELPSGPYREGFFEMMASHSEDAPAASEPDPALVDKFRAQALWDGTLSASVARALDAGWRPVFLVVGSYHCNRDGGTVQVLRQRRPSTRTLVVSFVAEDAEVLRDEDQDLADFVAYVGAFP